MILDIERFDEKSLILAPFFHFQWHEKWQDYLSNDLGRFPPIYRKKVRCGAEAKRLVFDVILFVLVSSWPSSTQLELTIGNALRKWELSAFYYIVQSSSLYCIVSSPGHKNWGHWWGWLTSIVGGHEWLIFYLKIWKMGKIFYSCLVGQK